MPAVFFFFFSVFGLASHSSPIVWRVVCRDTPLDIFSVPCSVFIRRVPYIYSRLRCLRNATTGRPRHRNRRLIPPYIRAGASHLESESLYSGACRGASGTWQWPAPIVDWRSGEGWGESAMAHGACFLSPRPQRRTAYAWESRQASK
ncbi:hypothetical protein EDB85DRAFT_357703 [Lactarius pseudohatsudake]|nr:hypothetical protein EDB85DRAFT_357703 [Lactarius pseudohatsudake]